MVTPNPPVDPTYLKWFESTRKLPKELEVCITGSPERCFDCDSTQTVVTLKSKTEGFVIQRCDRHFPVGGA